MADQNDYEAVLRALKSTDLRAISRELEAVDLRTPDRDLRIYLRLASALLNSPILREANMRAAAWLPRDSLSLRALADYCQKRAPSE